MKKILSIMIAGYMAVANLSIFALAAEPNNSERLAVVNHEQARETLLQLQQEIALRGPVTPINPYPNDTSIDYSTGRDYEIYIPLQSGVSAIVNAIPGGESDAKIYVAQKIVDLAAKLFLPEDGYITFTIYESQETFTTPYGNSYKKYIFYDVTVYKNSISGHNIILGPFNSPWFAPGSAYV